MEDEIIKSAEWHISCLNELLKAESELEKFRLKGSKDKHPRKKKSIKEMISNAFGNKKDSVTELPKDASERLRNLKRAQKHHLKYY